MAVNKGTEQARHHIAELIDTWPETPAFLMDKHMNVVAANRMVGVIFPGCEVGVNIVRYSFTANLPWFSQDELSVIHTEVAAALRDSLDRSEEDDSFVQLVGEIATVNDSFSQSWAKEVRSGADGTLELSDQEVGKVRVTWQMFDVPGESGDQLCVWKAADDRSKEALARLALRR